ncbi:MAG TPA: AtpZ/AtpI family protein [Gemmatales bacterium]|nr:AtpZ/AtpI family protein [Gemmatales bacterium]HMP58228.1 AtpZ/AtpI family protein [Gemmatales bacterium]
MPMFSSKALGDYARYSQLGLEMVAPIIAGYLLDAFVFGSEPWLTIAGAVFGLFWSLYRVIRLVEREERKERPEGVSQEQNGRVE